MFTLAEDVNYFACARNAAISKTVKVRELFVFVDFFVFEKGRLTLEDVEAMNDGKLLQALVSNLERTACGKTKQILRLSFDLSTQGALIFA